MKGGTPAIEKSKIVMVNKKKLLKLKLLNDCRVLNWVSTVLNSSQKSVINEVLYINIYVKRSILLSENRFKNANYIKTSKEF